MMQLTNRFGRSIGNPKITLRIIALIDYIGHQVGSGKFWNFEVNAIKSVSLGVPFLKLGSFEVKISFTKTLLSFIIIFGSTLHSSSKHERETPPEDIGPTP